MLLPRQLFIPSISGMRSITPVASSSRLPV